jgi:hypothetical protein
MPHALAIDLGFAAGFAFMAWKNLKHPRAMAIGMFFALFFTAMAFVPLAASLAYLVVSSSFGFMILIAADVYGGGVFVHEVWSGEKYDILTTNLASAASGLAAATTWVLWPQVSNQLKHLLPNTFHALTHSAALARAGAHGGMTQAQVLSTLRTLAIFAAIGAFVFWRHHRHRIHLLTASAKANAQAAKAGEKEAEGRQEKAAARLRTAQAKQSVRQQASRVIEVKPPPKALRRRYWTAAAREGRKAQRNAGGQGGRGVSRKVRGGQWGSPEQVLGGYVDDGAPVMGAGAPRGALPPGGRR